MMKKSRHAKKFFAAILIATMLLSVVLLAACGGEKEPEPTIYDTVAGTYDSFVKETTNEGFEKTNQSVLTLTLKADQTYSYEYVLTNTIYGALVYGKLEATVTGTYTAAVKNGQVYTITLSEITAITTAKFSCPKDLMGVTGSRDDTLTHVYNATLDDLKNDDLGLTMLSKGKALDIDLAAGEDDDDFTDSTVTGVDWMMPFTAVTAAKYDPTNPNF